MKLESNADVTALLNDFQFVSRFVLRCLNQLHHTKHDALQQRTHQVRFGCGRCHANEATGGAIVIHWRLDRRNRYEIKYIGLYFSMYSHPIR